MHSHISTQAVLSMEGVRGIVAAAAAGGVDTPELLGAVNVTAAELARAGWVDGTTEQRLWDEAALRAGDDLFGLHVGESLVVSEVPEILFHAARVSPTVGAALDRLARHFGLLHRRARVRFEADDRMGWLIKEADPSRGRLSPHGAMAMLSNVMLRLQYLLGFEFAAREVWFTRPRPRTIDEYVRIFGPAVRFGQPCDALLLDREQLDWPLPTRAPALLQVLDGHLERVSRRVDDDGFMDRVREIVAGRLHDASLGLAQTARQLGVSQRTLQRRLQLSGRSFQALLDQVRRDRALRQVAEGRLPLCEIAISLGFASVRPFYRAFKRWTGTTPGQHRIRA